MAVSNDSVHFTHWHAHTHTQTHMSPVDFISCKWNNWMVKYGEHWHQLWWKHNRNSVIASLLSSPGIHARSPHAATRSNQHRQMLRLFYPLQFFIFFKKLQPISKTWFFNWSNLYSMIKGREPRAGGRGRDYCHSKRPLGTRNHTLWSAKAAAFIWLSLQLWLQAHGKWKQRINCACLGPWHCLLSITHISDWTQNKLCENKH